MAQEVTRTPWEQVKNVLPVCLTIIVTGLGGYASFIVLQQQVATIKARQVEDEARSEQQWQLLNNSVEKIAESQARSEGYLRGLSEKTGK